MSLVHGRRRRVAVVDDDVGFADVVAWVLRLEGYDAEVHSDPVSALPAITTELPDVLLLDYRMPEGRGDELLDALADAGVYPRTIILTGCRDAPLRALASRGLCVLRKPVDMSHLLRAVKALLPTGTKTSP